MSLIKTYPTREYEYPRMLLGEPVKVAAVQIEPRLHKENGTLKKFYSYLESAAREGASLVVFPELSLTGLMKATAETVPGPSTEALSVKTKEYNVYVVTGMLEKHKEKFYNTAVLIGPSGIIGKYRKIHPWYPSESQIPVQPGDLGYPVFSTDIGKIGMMICYDAWFPEPTRVLALGGVDMIAFPTQTGLHSCFDYILRTRALENHVWIIGANGVGTLKTDEAETAIAEIIVGRSQIVSIFGEVLAEASSHNEETIYATIDVKAATQDKQLLPGSEWKKKADLFWARKPETYGAIVKS